MATGADVSTPATPPPPKTPTISLPPGLPDLRQFTYGTTPLQMSDLITQVAQFSLIGRMARDPELRSFDSGNCVCNVRILINKPGAKRDDGQEPDGFKLEIWGEKAQAFADATRKGDLVDVYGRIETETWTDRNTGEQRTGLVMLVEEWALAGKPRQASPAPAAAPQIGPCGPQWPAVIADDWCGEWVQVEAADA